MNRWLINIINNYYNHAVSFWINFKTKWREQRNVYNFETNLLDLACFYVR